MYGVALDETYYSVFAKVLVTLRSFIIPRLVFPGVADGQLMMHLLESAGGSHG